MTGRVKTAVDPEDFFMAGFAGRDVTPRQRRERI
jgi:hypothetical protein